MISLPKHTPRWIIFSLDTIISFCSVVLAFFLRFNFNLSEIFQDNTIFIAVPTVVILRILSFIITRTYAGIIRYTGTVDAMRIFFTILSVSLLLSIINIIKFYFFDGVYIIPFSIIIIDFFITTVILTGIRILIKMLYWEMYHSSSDRTNIIIYGTDDFALTTKHSIDRDTGMNYRVIAFIDNSTRNVGSILDSVKIYHVDALPELLKKYNVSKLIIAKPFLPPVRKREVVELCLSFDVQVLSVPPVTKWINGELSFNQIKDIKIEELLERDTIKLDEKEIKKQLANQIILVTGAAGSIGSEIVRQLTRFHPHKIILLDQAESFLYDIELELKEVYNFLNFQIIVADITNENRIKSVFNEYNPNIVFHAAAYKHVPVMENNPHEAIRVNVLGTKILADFSVNYKVKKFVFISTDKAVNPTNVMGASKRIAEIYIQSLNNISETKFITTRFGNVLGSNGSVIPRFKRQIEKGGPVTITHPEVTRYFMTIPEACQLVLEAGAMGKGGEIFIFDMGTSVKIIDLAKKMIKLSGLALGKDIRIEYTGLRPGEKLYEELLDDKENTIATHHPQIMIAKVREYNFNDILSNINYLIQINNTSRNNFEIVKVMKQIVPEFVSHNSVYEILDNTAGSDKKY